MRSTLSIIVAATLLAGCIGGKGTGTNSPPSAPTPNTLAVTVDSGPAAAAGQINHAYVTVHVCVPGSTTQCTDVDHVLLDTGSWGLRLVRSVLAAGAVTLSPETDAQGQASHECLHLGGGDTWGPAVLADVTLAGEVAAKLPVQIMDDSPGVTPPTSCGGNGLLLNDVTGFGANGLLGVGVFAEDCGDACVNASPPMEIYYGCTAAGVCTAENVARSAQVANPVAKFAADNNGFIVNMPSLQNANGDATVQGELIFGIGTQTDNALPATGLTVLGADTTTGDFTATYNGGTTVLPALIDSGTDSYKFDDPTIPVCTADSSGNTYFVGYYCPIVHPQSAFAVNAGVGVYNASSTVNFAIADPNNTFVLSAAAFINLAGGGGSTRFTWGMPFFYGRKIYFGIDKRVADIYTGPFYAY